MPRYALTIQCDTAAELAAVARYLDDMPADAHAFDPQKPPPPPPRPQPPKGRDAADPPTSTDPAIRTGNQLYAWAREHDGALRKINALGKSRGYPGMLKSWSHDQVADVCHELQQHGQMGAKT